jgi:4-hydroxy-tetrahydrodipicolinate reductase
MPKRVVISGATGRMGQALAALIQSDPELEAAGGLDVHARSGAEAKKFGVPEIAALKDGAELIRNADVIIDFSAAAGTRSLLQEHGAALSGKALVIGTTGLTDDINALIADVAKRAPVIVSANYSIGVNLMLGVVASAARVLQADHFDVEVIETHHRHKKDAPSGTALLLARTVAEAREAKLDELRRDGRSGDTGERPEGEIALHSLRGGEVVGEHRVLFIGAHERFEIAHAAQDRGLFAEGALLAAKWIVGKPARLYSMKDVLGL